MSVICRNRPFALSLLMSKKGGRGIDVLGCLKVVQDFVHQEYHASVARCMFFKEHGVYTLRTPCAHPEYSFKV